jgi:HCOMODA/2-hydroxy-3-carboxy-muconic semialdehyde decarboxylase
LAEALGQNTTVLMRGHGATVVGTSIRQAVYRAVYAEVNARLQCDAIRMGGEVDYLTTEEAHAAMTTNNTQLARAWDMWASQAPSPV